MKWSAKSFLGTQLAIMALALGSVSSSLAVQSAAGPTLSSFANASLYFEANGNQFIARGQNCNVTLTPGEATLILSKPAKNETFSHRTETRLVRLELMGANSLAQLAGIEQLPGKANYFIGDRSEWRTGLPLFAKVQANEIYPGVRVVYYANQSAQLEYDFVVQPRADAKQISFRIEGADKVSVDAGGNLVLKIGNDEVRQHAPVIYQNVRGERKEIRGGYRQAKDGTVGFWLADYDKDLPLVIDPTIDFATFLGGSKTEFGLAIAVDASGNSYVTGETLSKNLPVANALFPIYAGGSSAFGDAFVASYDSSGALRYLTYLGGKRDDGALGIAVDDSGVAYLTGFTDSRDFPLMNPIRSVITGRDNNALHVPPVDGFVATLSADGSQLLYSTLIGGSGRDEGVGIALTGGGVVCVTGLTESTNELASTTNRFVPLANGYQTNFAGVANAFALKLPTDGTTNGYAMTYLGGKNTEYGESVAVDDSANVWVTGFTTSTNFPITNAFAPLEKAVMADVVTVSNHVHYTNSIVYTNVTTFTALNRQTNGTVRADAFISKFSSDLSQLLFSVYVGGSNDDAGLHIAAYGDSALVTGYTRSADFPTNLVTAPASSASSYGSHAFVVKVNPDNSLGYSSAFGGSRSDQGIGIAADGGGNAYVVGVTSSTNFFATNSFTELGAASVNGKKMTNNVFVAVLSPDGTSFDTNKNILFGGSGNDEANGIAVNSTGDTVYLVGQTTSSTNFPSVNAAQPILGNGKKPSKIADAFIAKIVLTNAVETVGEGKR